MVPQALPSDPVCLPEASPTDLSHSGVGLGNTHVSQRQWLSLSSFLQFFNDGKEVILLQTSSQRVSPEVPEDPNPPVSIRKGAIYHPRSINVFTGGSSPEPHHPCYEHLHSHENTMTKKKASSSLPNKLSHCLGLPFVLPQTKNLV